MDWDRRAFVKFAVGAVGGLHASPLVFKLMDDVAIWTQNWDWVPKPEMGGLAHASTVNPATGTGVNLRLIQARVSGQRVIRVEGNPEHPLSQGGVVPADATAPQALYNQGTRATRPMMRDSKGGVQAPADGKTALTALAAKLAALQEAGTPEKLVVLADDPDSAVGEMLRVFMAAYGSPNLVFAPSAKQTLALAGQLMLGQKEIGFDLAGSDYIVSFGTPLLEGFGAPVALRKSFVAWRQAGAKLVQVEPRASVTASQADTWLACKPGAEGLVALGLCNLLVAGGASAEANGMGDFKSLLAKYSPDAVAKQSGVAAEKLAKVAAALAKAKKPVAVCGPGNSMDPGRLYDFMAVLALNILLGNLGKPGGLLVRQPLPLKKASVAPVAKPRLDEAEKTPLGADNIHALALNSLEGKPYAPEVVLVVGTNPAFAGPQAAVMQEFFNQAPFLAAISPQLDETSAQADLLLPAATFLEGWGDCCSPYGSPVAAYGLHRPLVNAFPEVKSTGDWLLALAKGLGGPVASALSAESMEEYLKARCEGMGDFEELSQKGFWVQAKPAHGAFAFGNASGKPELFSSSLQQAVEAKGVNPKELGVEGPAYLPHFEAPEAADKDYPLLMAAIPSLRTGPAGRAMTPHMVKILDNTTLAHTDKLVVEINPQTAHKLHLHEGQAVTLESPAGAISALVHLFAGAAPDMVFVPVGLGHAAFDQFLQGKGANYNQAVTVTADPMSGLPQWGLTPVRIKGASHV